MDFKAFLNKLRNDSLVYTLSSLSTRMVSFILFPLFARKFSVEDYGVIGLLTTFSFLLSTLAGLGLDSATSRWFFDQDQQEGHHRKAFTSWFVVQASITLLISAIILTGSYLFPLENFLLAKEPHLILLLVCLNLLFSLPSSMLNLLFMLKQSSVYSMYLSIASTLLSAIASCAFVFVFDMGLVGFYLGQTVAFFCCSVVGLFFWYKSLFTKLPERSFILAMVRYGTSIIPANVSAYLLLFLTSLIIKQYSSQTELGYYQVGFTLASIISMVAGPFNQAFQPLSLSIMNKPEAGNKFSLVLDLYVMMMSTLCLALGLFFTDAVNLLLTEKFLKSDFVAASLSFSNFIYSLNVIAAVGLTIKKKLQYFGTTVACCNMLIIGLVFASTYLFGIQGAAFSFVIGNSITIGLLFIMAQRVYYIPFQFGRNVVTILLALVLFLLGYQINHLHFEHSFLWRLGLMGVFFIYLLSLNAKPHFYKVLKGSLFNS